MNQPGNLPQASSTRSTLQEYLTGAWTTQAIYVAAELRLADLLALGPQTSAKLAELTGSHEPSLRQLLRALSTIELVRITADGAYRLGPVGERLRSDRADSLRNWALWWGRSLWPAWSNLLHSVRTGESARALAIGSQGFDHLAHDPAAAEIFYNATVELSRQSAPALLAAFDFSRYPRIIDVGGGYGELLAQILIAHPSATGVLLELSQAVDGARRHLAAAGVSDRCQVIEGDFFQDVPADADLYLLTSVLHDWRDDRARQVLVTCRRAMRERARLILVEQVIAEPGDPGDLAPIADLTMLVAHGARERSRQEFEALLHETGFSMAQVLPISGALSIIEAVPFGPRMSDPPSAP